MTTYTIRSNLDQGSQVLVPDLGFLVPASGGTVVFSDDGNINEINESLVLGSLAVLTNDSTHVGGTDASDHTIIIDINGTDVPPGEGDRAVNVIPLTVEEQDGSPSIAAVTKIKVPNGSLTDDGNGVVSLSSLGDYAGKFEGLTIGTGDIPDGKWGWWFDTNVPNRLLHIRNRGGTLYATEANPL